MIRDITIGQYYPVRSVIHKLDPRTKLAGTLLFIITVFLFRSGICSGNTVSGRYYYCVQSPGKIYFQRAESDLYDSDDHHGI